MHIGFVTSEYPTTKKPEGGLGTYIRKVSLELIQRGHSVTVFVLASKRHCEIDHGVNLHFIKRMKFHWRFHRTKALHLWLDLEEQRINARRVKKAVLARNKANHIDILQVPNFKTPGLYLCHNKFFPVVCRCSSYQPLLRSANGIQRSLPEAIADWLETRQVVEADAAFSPSRFIARTYERFEAVTPKVIRTPPDLSQVNIDPSIYLRIGEGKKYLLYFGALNGVKGVDLIIQAIPGILSENRDLNFIFIGRNDPLPNGISGYDSLQHNLRKYMDERRVIYLNALPKSQLFPIIEHALGVIMPSRVDNYPNACLEALMLGVPVIGTYDSSLDEMIEDGKTGFLSQNGDFESLKNIIQKFLDMNGTEINWIKKNIVDSIINIQAEDPVLQLIDFYKTVIGQFKK